MAEVVRNGLGKTQRRIWLWVKYPYHVTYAWSEAEHQARTLNSRYLTDSILPVTIVAVLH